MITLKKKEQILGLQMLKNSISKNGQTAYISHAFYSVICKLKKVGLVVSIKKGRECDYKLTDDGKILFSIIANFEGNEEYKDSSLKGLRAIKFD